MKLCVMILLLLVGTSTMAACPAGWTDAGGGNCSLARDPLVMTEQEATRAEKIHAYHNYLYRYSGATPDTADWLDGLLQGLDAPRIQGRRPAAPQVFGFLDSLWAQYVGQLHEEYPGWLVTPGADRNANGEAAAIPAPVAAPAP